ncbi:hypothetical protein A0J61_11882, partial [Choanephora cucurbitarum]
ERNYGVSEVEALAIVWGIKKFAHYLTSTPFTVITDHQALQFLRHKNSDLRGRLARWALSLQQHDFKIVYRPGSKNAGPDALSRFPAVSDSMPLVWSIAPSDLRSAQATNPYCLDLRSAALPLGFSDASGVLFFHSRPVLPRLLWNEMFELLHSNVTTGHLGIGRTLQQFSRLFYFPGQNEWVKKKVKECQVCQRVKRSNATLGYINLIHTNPPVHPFDTIAIDSFGPLPPSRLGNKYTDQKSTTYLRSSTYWTFSSTFIRLKILKRQFELQFLSE